MEFLQLRVRSVFIGTSLDLQMSLTSTTWIVYTIISHSRRHWIALLRNWYVLCIYIYINIQVVFGLNWESIETISTIRREYPKIEIVVVDTNSENFIQTYFGDQVHQEILKIHKENNVKCITHALIKEIKQKKNESEIIFRDGVIVYIYMMQTKVSADTLLMFPNTTVANTQFLQEYYENIDYDQVGRIKVDILQRSGNCNFHYTIEVKRIFAAGRCATTSYFVNGDRYPCRDTSASFQQGITAAYNIMALVYLYIYISYSYRTFHGTTSHSGTSRCLARHSSARGIGPNSTAFT